MLKRFIHSLLLIINCERMTDAEKIENIKIMIEYWRPDQKQDVASGE
jgi:hypothetical protein